MAQGPGDDDAEVTPTEAGVPYLPDSPRRARELSLQRSLAWLAVVVVLVGPTAASAAGASDSIIRLIGMAAVGLLSFGYVWQLRRFNTQTRQALLASGRGDHEGAARIFERWIPRAPGGVSVTARHNLAWMRMRRGRPQLAIDLLARNEAHPWMLRIYGLHGTAALDLALCHALIGQPAAAQAWLAAAERRRSTQLTHAASRAFAAAVLDCRRDRHAEVARDLEDRWVEHEAVAAGDVMRPLRIVRAFAVASAGPREAGQAAALLVKPAYPGEFDFLAVEWPEMASFLAAHDLGGAAA